MEEKNIVFKKLFSCVILRLYTEFQCPTMPGNGQHVCGVGGGGGKEEKKSLRNCLVVLFLGCIPNFNVQLCLELVKKFVVGGGWLWCVKLL